MQGKKYDQEKLFISFQLSEREAKNNFYRRLKGALDLDFLYSHTKEFLDNRTGTRKNIERENMSVPIARSVVIASASRHSRRSSASPTIAKNMNVTTNGSTAHKGGT
jgi:hypothetical protein